MDVNLNNLSATSKHIERENNYKNNYSKFLTNYMSLIQNKPIIDSFCHLNEDGTKSNDIIHRKGEITLLNNFMDFLSRSNKQIENDRKEYLDRLKHFHGESDEVIKLKQKKRCENVKLYQRLNDLLEFGQQKVRIGKKRKRIEDKTDNVNKSGNNDKKNKIRIRINKSVINRSKEFNKSMNNKYLKFDKNKLNESSKRALRISNHRPLLKNFSSNYNNKIRLIKKIQDDKQNEKIIKMNIKKTHLYKKQWNKSKGFFFKKFLGRNSTNPNKFRIIIREKDYSPKYDYILPNTSRRIVCYDDKGYFNLNEYKKLSTKKAIFNCFNNNDSYDENYNIMNLINKEKEKIRIKKQEKLNDINIYNIVSDYLNRKKETGSYYY